jgi:hypothetical protein
MRKMMSREFTNHELMCTKFDCPVSGKLVDISWTDERKNSRRGLGNSCIHCAGEKDPRQGYFFGRYYILPPCPPFDPPGTLWRVKTTDTWGATLVRYDTEAEAMNWARRQTEGLNREDRDRERARDARDQEELKAMKKLKRQKEISIMQQQARDFGSTSCWPGPHECWPLSAEDREDVDRLFPGV